MTAEDRKRPSILIVDDVPSNIALLGEVLLSQYDVRVVTSGMEALGIVASEKPPDLILLDIMMPGMDGYAVCHEIKKIDNRKDIPVIFITARRELEDETKGFELGAVDYIAKPFQLSVVKERVRTHLELKRHRDHLEEIVQARTEEIRAAYGRLQSLNRELKNSLIQLRLTQEHLIQSEKMAALGGLVAGVAHEISTPVGIGFTAASFLAMKTKQYSDLNGSNGLTREDIEKYMLIANEAAEIIHTNLRRAGELITSFKQVGTDQANEESRRFNFKQYLQTILFSLQPKLKPGKHKIHIDCPESIVITSYPGVFSQIITNLVVNSVIHGFEEISGGEINLRVSYEGGKLRLSYQDNGRGMTDEHLGKIFDPFFTTKRNDGGTGLGMHITYNLVTQVLGGRIQCERGADKGLGCTITVPV